MCGIAALFGKNYNSDQLSFHIQNMLNAIHHRGPDDEGHVIFPENSLPPIIKGGNDTPSETFKVKLNYCPSSSNRSPKNLQSSAAIGHRRLSIIDLTANGHQPLCSRDGRYWITYNGEIYNYIELRCQLQKLGVTFHSETDTEVVLNAFIHWGVDCLNHFNGMFSLVIFDIKTNKIFAARDRFGIKPLYYTHLPDSTTAFASEIKQFTVLPQWKAHLNHQRAYDYLNWSMTDHTEETLFSNVFHIPGGYYVFQELKEICNGQIYPKQWYSLSLENPKKINFADACEEFKGLFFDSIKLRLRADVNVGSCLSGGLDSSTIVCTINQILNSSNSTELQKTFSACSQHKMFDERPFIDEVINKYPLDPYYVYPEWSQLIKHLQELTWQQDEPFGSSSVFAQWSIFKLVKEQNVKVMLDGQGADEMLAGYHSYFGYHFLDLFKTMRWGKLVNEMKQVKHHHGLPSFSILMNRLLPDIVKQPLIKALHKPHASPSWLNYQKLKVDQIFPIQANIPKSVASFGKQQILHSNLPMLLRYEDRNSMHHSVEARTPFLDYRLVEFCLNLEGGHKLDGYWTKKILRESMKNILPSKIRLRTDKMAFITPEEHWLKKEHIKARDLIKEAIDISDQTLSPEILNVFDGIISKKIPFSYLPWRVICFGQWIKAHKVNI
ncbi:MAG: asparagine synthase (glutamine-hydrolyzing) [Chlamydiota bacterium]|nr:asparagine synthase (glutamine-hydrolyzing) [Chlamydiota bacterium]